MSPSCSYTLWCTRCTAPPLYRGEWQKFVSSDAASFIRPTQGFALIRLHVDLLGVVQNDVHVLVESLEKGWGRVDISIDVLAQA